MESSSKVSEYVIDSSLWILCKMYKKEYGDQSDKDLYLRHIQYLKTSHTHIKNKSDVIDIL